MMPAWIDRYALHVPGPYVCSSVCVARPVSPGGASVPTSTSQNGRYDDVIGNGALAFNDVVLLFNTL